MPQAARTTREARAVRTARASLIDHGDAIRALAERWLPAVSTEETGRSGAGDFACSPAGLWLALSAAAAGAGGDTAGELRELLGAAGEGAATATTEVARALALTDALAVATGVWTRTPVLRAFRAALPEIGFGDLGPEHTARLDSWVREATGGLIERLPAAAAPDTLLMLVNALALKARWADPFDPANTGPGTFTDAAGERHRVPTMHRTVPVADAWSTPDPGTTVVELRCAAGPGPGGALPALVRFVLGDAPNAPAEEVLPAAWAPPGARTAFDADEVSIALPRLSLRTRLSVLPHLAPLGARLATSGEADFSRMSPERLTIGQVVQECMVKVAEMGVEAAAVTAVTMVPAAAVVRPRRTHRIAFDRPFGIVVLDGSGAVPLFTAWQATAPRNASALQAVGSAV